MLDKPFTVKTLADRWSVSPSYIYRLIADGKLRAFHFGGTLKRITAEEVRRWESGRGDQITDLTASENSGSDGSSTSSASSGTTTASGGVTDLASQRNKTRERNYTRLLSKH
jgi:excisionase family DNA binding protein